jgi:antitoxin Phd
MFQCTLHEAMRVVLSEQQRHAVTTSQLSEEIERRGLYARKDGAAARARQINARARKYPNLFVVDNSGYVRLSDSSAYESAV